MLVLHDIEQSVFMTKNTSLSSIRLKYSEPTAHNFSCSIPTYQQQNHRFPGSAKVLMTTGEHGNIKPSRPSAGKRLPRSVSEDYLDPPPNSTRTRLGRLPGPASEDYPDPPRNGPGRRRCAPSHCGDRQQMSPSSGATPAHS